MCAADTWSVCMAKFLFVLDTRYCIFEPVFLNTNDDGLILPLAKIASCVCRFQRCILYRLCVNWERSHRMGALSHWKNRCMRGQKWSTQAPFLTLHLEAQSDIATRRGKTPLGHSCTILHNFVPVSCTAVKISLPRSKKETRSKLYSQSVLCVAGKNSSFKPNNILSQNSRKLWLNFVFSYFFN